MPNRPPWANSVSKKKKGSISFGGDKYRPPSKDKPSPRSASSKSKRGFKPSNTWPLYNGYFGDRNSHLSKTAKSLSLQIGGGNFKSKPKTSLPTRNLSSKLPKPHSFNSYIGNSFSGGPIKPIRGHTWKSQNTRHRPFSNSKNRPQSPAEFFYSNSGLDPYSQKA